MRDFFSEKIKTTRTKIINYYVLLITVCTIKTGYVVTEVRYS